MAYMGLPAIVLTIAANHQDSATRFGKLGIVEALGWYHTCSDKIIAESIERLASSKVNRISMSSKGMQLVDGLGALRIVKAMTS